MNAHCIDKNHNAEDVRLKARPVGRCPKARLYVIASYHAISMLSKQCLDSGFWAAPEFMILNQRCPNYLVSTVAIDSLVKPNCEAASIARTTA